MNKIVRRLMSGASFAVLSFGVPNVARATTISGNVPGNYNPAATECFQEGVVIPPVKLFEAGKLLDEAGWRRGPNGIRQKDGVELPEDVYQRMVEMAGAPKTKKAA